MLFNYLGYHSPVVDVFVCASLLITLVSGLHPIWHTARAIEAERSYAASHPGWPAGGRRAGRDPERPIGSKQAVVRRPPEPSSSTSPETAPNQTRGSPEARGRGHRRHDVSRMVKLGLNAGRRSAVGSVEEGRVRDWRPQRDQGEARADKMTRGSVAALIPEDLTARGSVFIVSPINQPSVGSTVFRQVSDGMEVWRRFQNQRWTPVASPSIASRSRRSPSATRRPFRFVKDSAAELAQCRVVS